MRRARVVILALFALAAALPFSAAFAQYPAPVGACSIAPNQPSVLPNSTLTWTVSVLNGSGGPAAGVSGTVSITSGQGTLGSPLFTSDSAGKAIITVTTGATPGDIALAVTCGSLQTSTVLKVAPPTIIPKAPDTGFGTGDSGSGFPFLWIFAGIALVSVAGASTVAVTRRR